MKINSKIVIVVFYIIVIILSGKRYYSLLPTIPVYPNNEVESNKVKQISDKRTQEDIDFANTIDLGLTGPFEKIIPEPKANIEKVAHSLNIVIITLKLFFNRARPKQVNKSINTLKSLSAQTPAYPSGHAFQSYLIAKTYSKKYPELREKLWNLADKCAFARINAGLHYPSDGKFSKYLVMTYF